MQWCSGKNLGFSTSDTPYLPVDTDENAPTVENQQNDPNSVYKIVTDMIALRHANDDLKGNGELDFIFEAGKFPFGYKRGKFVMLFNPLGKASEMKYDLGGAKQVYAIGNTTVEGDIVKMDAQSFAMFEI